VAESERAHAEASLAAATAAARDRLQHDPATLLKDAETRSALAATTAEELEARLAKLRASRERLGPVNLRAEAEMAELGTEIGEAQARQAELQQAVDRLRGAIATLDREGRERLTAVFESVDGHFRRLFATLFGGGKAHLRLAGSSDPLQAGLELEASPPGKKLTSISLLSGGEKTLTALALVFAFFLAQPSPLCVLDEVDAPLDDANVDRFVSLMREIAEATGTRFLAVTHHPLTMARMDRLYGVTMAERGISRLVSVALEQALELRATA
jgi:chromosome segregation protein